MSSILSEFTRFLDARSTTIFTLMSIKTEIDAVKKNANSGSLATRVVSLGAGIVSVGCIVAAPFTGGASTPVAVGMAVLSGTSAAASIGIQIAKTIEESGLKKKASAVIKKDQEARVRLKAAVETLRTLASVSRDTVTLLENAAAIGIACTKDIDAILRLTGSARAVQLATKSADVLAKVNRVMKVAGSVLVIVSIPLDIIGIVIDLLNRGKVSEASQQIQENINLFRKEYETIEEEYHKVRSLIEC